MDKSMWYEIRKKAGLSQIDVARQFGVSKQYIWNLENGVTSMPKKYQIFYLSLRGSDSDQVIIEYLKELNNKSKEND